MIRFACPRVALGSGIVTAATVAAAVAGWGVALGGALASSGCRGSTAPATPAARSAAASPGGFRITERGESGPIVAIAARPPHLWASGPGGLRRWTFPGGDVETMGTAASPGARGVVAISVDDEGAAWVASPDAFGRWVAPNADAEPRFEALPAPPGRVTALAARRPVRAEGVWAGGPDGLYAFDGRAWSRVPELTGKAVTTLVPDDDGKAAWVGTRGHGLYRAAGARAAAVPDVAVDEIVGIATTGTGTRVVAGGFGQETRIYALTLAGVEGFHASGARVFGLVSRRGGAALLASPRGQDEPQVYTLKSFGPSEPIPSGALRFTPIARDRGAAASALRWAGVPTGEQLPAAPTVATALDGALYCGSAGLGVVRAATTRPQPLEGGELVGDARHLYVGCPAGGREHCYVVTEGPRAWLTDGDRWQRTSVGEPAGASVQALATDAQGGLFAVAVAVEAQAPGLAITKHVPADASGPERWQLVHRIALELLPRRAPSVSFAAISPAGVLWVGLRTAAMGSAGDGATGNGATGNGSPKDDDRDESGFGAAEIDLASGHLVQHRPRRRNEPPAPEALPLPAELTAVMFDRGATWYASMSGVSRFQEGQLRTWGENDGLTNERVHAVARVAQSGEVAGGGAGVWAATSSGVARFDGQQWRGFGSELAVRGLASDARGRTWLATSQGLRAFAAGQGTPAADPAQAPVILPGDMRDVAVDRQGRVWAMSSSTVTTLQPTTAGP